MTNRPEIPETDYDPYTDENLRDPFPGYRMLRRLGPVVYLGRHDLYALSRHADVSAALSDWETFSPADGMALNSIINDAGRRLSSLPLGEAAVERWRAPYFGARRVQSETMSLSQ